MIFDFTDHTGQTIQLTDNANDSDAPYKVPPRLQSLLDQANDIAINGEKHGEKKLKRWIEENPGLPQLKNFLTVFYEKTGHRQKAFEYNRRVAERHPNYLFVKFNLAAEALKAGRMGDVPQILGESLQLQNLNTERRVFHTVEYAAFYKVVFRYLYNTGQHDKAIKVMDDLDKLQDETGRDFDLKHLQTEFVLTGMKGMLEKMKAKDSLPKPVMRTEATLPQTEEAPKFHHPQIQWLYQNSFAIEKEKLAGLLQLERASLVNDLTEVIYDAIRRFDFFQENEYDEKTHSFVLHALYLAKEWEAAEVLPAILELLRQPEELLDYWLSDLITDNIWQVVYSIGKQDLPALEEYLKEPLNFTYARSAVSTAVSQLAMHSPERRSEALAVYERLFDYYYQHKESPEIYDAVLVSFMIGDVADFNAVELRQNMKRFYDEKRVDEFIEGSWSDVEKELETKDEDREHPRKMKLQTLYEIVDELHGFELRNAAEEAENGDEENKDFDDYELVDEERKGETNYFYTGGKPYQREEAKVGRNDPCPCGSGLKYKKCHGKGQ